jgi:hypothetical protein
MSRKKRTHRPVFHEVPAIRKLHRGDDLDDVTLLMVSSIPLAFVLLLV